jgi:ABC-type polysaccharide/polyol phosphate transport system ATPase subunit
MKELVVYIDDIGKFFQLENGKQITVLENISFSVNRGETVALIGENGSGKTTLLKILAEIIKPSFGVAKIFGKTAALIDIDGFFERDLTGRENVTLFLKMHAWENENIATTLFKIKELSGINDFFDRPLKTYSKGMQSRLILSAALQLKAEVFLIDEVFFAGDEGFIRQIEDKKNELSKKGVSFIIATHNPEEVKMFADRCIWLHENQIKLRGDSETVLGAYHKYLTAKLSRQKGKILHSEQNTKPITRLENDFVKGIKITPIQSDLFSYNYGFQLKIEYEVFKTQNQILLGIQLLDRKKKILCISSVINSKLENDKQILGKKTYHFQFPKETLVQGDYFLELLFFKAPYTDLPHLEEVFRFPILTPLKIHPDETFVYGEDDPNFPLNLKANWTQIKIDK